MGVVEIDEWDHHTVARKIVLTDIEGNNVALTIFNNNDCASYEWDVGRWYRLEEAVGDVYNGEKQLKPSWDFNIVSLDNTPSEATDEAIRQLSEEESAEAQDSTSSKSANSLGRGNYLLHYCLGELPELQVHSYQLRVPGGIDEQDDGVENGILGFTARVAAQFRYQTQGPATTNGPLRIYSVSKVSNPIEVAGHTVEPEHTGVETLEARSFDDREPLRELVKQDLKAALAGQYDVKAINSIIEFEPEIRANSGDFTASREYKCRIWIDPDGTVICGVDSSYHLQSTFSAAEYVRNGHEIEGVTVEHDTDVYENGGTGTVQELVETGYEEFVDEMGSSIAEYHRTRGYVNEETIQTIAASEPIMAQIDYGTMDGLQALEYCSVVPTLDQLKLLDGDFHGRFQSVSRKRPNERFSIARSFIESVGTTPSLALKPSTRPSNVCYDEISINSNRSNLRFKDGKTASYGAKGLDRHGVYQSPSSFDLLFLYPQRYQNESSDFVRLLLKKLHAYGTSPTKIEREAYALGSEFDYTQVADQATDFDGVVAVVPDEGWIEDQIDIDDPYPEFKQQFGQKKLPSQMVAVSSLSEDDYLGNIAAGLVAKCGGIPWRVHDVPGDTDVFIGLDVTYDTETEQHVGASANVVLGDGSILASQSTSLQSGETFQIDDIVDVIKNLLNIYLEEEDGTPNHVVIHRDGQFYLDLEALVERLEKASDLIPKFDLVEIRKSGNPRIASYTGDRFESARKGTAFESENADHAYLATTGKPERLPGTPQPIRVVKRHGSTDLSTLAKQAYWLSEAHVASISRSTRLPITTYYADRCAEHARKGYLLNGELLKGVPYV
ncbi:Piwi domain-containing protein [Halosimplex aquaticum]|uniref:Piwi domain-containing protein n=1 Tax=Halosimplex aquaticum TaxID=3026162 RepID=A0ABD5Y359_9EURY|nr:Piwi domain-containing protein [Halosimplex aquaticum]